MMTDAWYSMAGIVEPLRPARILARPKKFAPLRSFSCGRDGELWERMVNEWASSWRTPSAS
jgi:hypothetical protein